MKPDADGVYRCACCGMPFAKVDGGAIHIVSRHRGEKHENVIKVADLEETEQSS